MKQRKYVTTRLDQEKMFSLPQLVYYPGNLSAFVAEHPEAKSYYTLAATSVKFSFPPPGSLMGVRSNTRAILKLSNCTFTYPGRTAPSLYNVSCALSLSRSVCLDVLARHRSHLWPPAEWVLLGRTVLVNLPWSNYSRQVGALLWKSFSHEQT
jgi:hypothetical protein